MFVAPNKIWIKIQKIELFKFFDIKVHIFNKFSIIL
ncbi:hypothetical protein CIB43_00626 [Mesomycoplasma hyopneumoniae]|uniref:Uncharacterized protein n=1 Tax=Mesomycoplasma hyopneumoniae TaxID=2099 RepID=A0A223MAS6_MESHO|nr:hypothetical protein CIB43_00626 [Mesomycoplasma hyopneumoniae]